MTQVVQLSDEAYRRLKMCKRKGDSFSDVVLRLTGEGDLRSLQGLRSAEEIDDHEQEIEAIDALDRPER